MQKFIIYVDKISFMHNGDSFHFQISCILLGFIECAGLIHLQSYLLLENLQLHHFFFATAAHLTKIPPMMNDGLSKNILKNKLAMCYKLNLRD